MNRERIEATVSDREALAAALEMLYEPDPDEQGRNTTPVRYPLDVIGAAARERLAQLPEKCEHGETEPHRVDPRSLTGWVCPGKVYPAELVERIAKVLTDGPYSLEGRAVAVLDALNGETE